MSSRNPAGETSVRIQGADNWQTLGEAVTTTPGILIPASLVDRQGLALRNFNDSGLTLYIQSFRDSNELRIRYWV